MGIENEYFIPLKAYGGSYFYLTTDDRTSSRNYNFTKLKQSEGPLIFKSSTSDKDKKKGVVRKITNILMDGLGILLSNELMVGIADFNFQGMQFFPAIFIDDQGVWHENYWYMNFYEEFDCWDREKSRVIPSANPDAEMLPNVESYVFNDLVINESNKTERVAFKMGGCSLDYLFLHRNLVEKLEALGTEGVRFMAADKYEEGDQFLP